MGRTGWIIVIAIVALILLRPGAISSVVAPLSNPQRPPGYDFYGSPPPGANYASSPPTHASTSVSDVINNVISSGTQLYNTYLNRGASNPAPVGSGTLSFSD